MHWGLAIGNYHWHGAAAGRTLVSQSRELRTPHRRVLPVILLGHELDQTVILIHPSGAVGKPGPDPPVGAVVKSGMLYRKELKEHKEKAEWAEPLGRARNCRVLG